MKELLEAIDSANNVKSITYYPDTKTWMIRYRNELEPDELPSADLIDFLNNA